MGEPDNESAVTFDPVSPNVVPVAFVKVSVLTADAPEIFKLPPWRKPDAVTFELETEASVDCPETVNVPPLWSPVDAVRDEPEAFVKESVVINPFPACKYPEAVRFVPEAFTNDDVVTAIVPKVTVEPVARWRFTRADETLFRSDKLFAIRRAPMLEV
jgi:hypothetical protein